jgi:hypothetical protein
MFDVITRIGPVGCTAGSVPGPAARRAPTAHAPTAATTTINTKISGLRDTHAPQRP